MNKDIIDWEKIDKFYLVLALILVPLSVLFVFSVRGVFSMFLTANELDPNALNPGIRVEREKLTEAYDFVFSKGIVHLENIPAVPVPAKEKK